MGESKLLGQLLPHILQVDCAISFSVESCEIKPTWKGSIRPRGPAPGRAGEQHFYATLLLLVENRF